MQSKLTLSINSKVIRDAKAYASEHNTSLSSVVEALLRGLSATPTNVASATPIVSELAKIKVKPLVSDARDLYADYLIEKYQDE